MTLTAENRERLKRVSVATLTTCLFKRGFRNAFIQGVHPISPDGPRMVGEAFTLRYIPAREDIDVLDAYADPEHPQRKAIETCPPGHVLVIDSRKDARAASAGDILLTRLMVRGVAGAVTDGGFRDTPAIAKLGFPAYHARPSAPTGPILHHACDLQVPIGCGDVPVYPGDIVVGDGEGVVVIPARLANEVAEEAVTMTEYEDFVEEQVRQGRRLPGLYPATPESRRAFEAWRRTKGEATGG
ncbi:ribonuclease activity regulator RraA [Benzoatithermus flavus]|uniref:Ribonuclease activity regulator RraA n=1 Tax=Benzoatithermus flavus TaxID=3108223 RepID=A0ABU8XRL1_9PROT